jgi:Cu/Ag efflux pump CusA
MMTGAAIITGLLPILYGTGSEVISRITAPMVGEIECGYTSVNCFTSVILFMAFVIDKKHSDMNW